MILLIYLFVYKLQMIKTRTDIVDALTKYVK